MKRREETGVPDPDLKSILARVEQSCDKADAVMIKVSTAPAGATASQRLPPPARAMPSGGRAEEYLCLSWFRLKELRAAGPRIRRLHAERKRNR